MFTNTGNDSKLKKKKKGSLKSELWKPLVLVLEDLKQAGKFRMLAKRRNYDTTPYVFLQ